MNVDFYKPQSEILSRYIEGFYFMNEDVTYPLQYLTFPNNFCILSLINNATLDIQENEVFINASDNKNQICSLSYHYKTQLRINYLEYIEEFTIYFKPNAINHFVENMVDFYNPKSVKSFEPFDEFKKSFFQIFEIKDRTSQIEYIETLLLSIFKEKKDTLIENLLIDIESDLSISEIAFKNGISRQYFNQYFKLKIGKSPSEYRKISRFRKSLNLFNQQKKSFTEISYDNLFFDQSHFNRDFKALTNLTPKEFLANTNLNKENIWFII